MDESVVWVIMGLLVDLVTGFQTKKFNTHLGGSKWLDKGTISGTNALPQCSIVFQGTVSRCNPSVIRLAFRIRPAMLLVGQVRRYIEFYSVRAGGSCLWNCIVRTALPAVYVLLCSLTFSIIHLLLLFKHFGRSPSMHSCIDHDFPCSGKHPQFSPQFSVIIFPTLSFSLPPLRRLQV